MSYDLALPYFQILLTWHVLKLSKEFERANAYYSKISNWYLKYDKHLVLFIRNFQIIEDLLFFLFFLTTSLIQPKTFEFTSKYFVTGKRDKKATSTTTKRTGKRIEIYICLCVCVKRYIYLFIYIYPCDLTFVFVFNVAPAWWLQQKYITEVNIMCF